MSATEQEILGNTITDKDVWRALVEAGILSPEDRIRRIVIDIRVNRPVALHIERVGDKRLLDALVPALQGIAETRLEPYDDGVNIDYDAKADQQQ